MVKYAIMDAAWQKMTETVVLRESGRIVLPASICNELGLNAGDRLTVSRDESAVHILSGKMALANMRAGIVKQRGILDEFLKERREETRHQ